jgi:hypothetical protein
MYGAIALFYFIRKASEYVEVSLAVIVPSSGMV